jgi:hypothetical protein
MKTSMANLLLFLSLSSTAFATDIPVDPGATLSATITKAMRDKSPDSGLRIDSEFRVTKIRDPRRTTQ